jgi:DNA replication protein DnaC
MEKIPFPNSFDLDKKVSLVIKYNDYPNLHSGMTELSVNQAIEQVKNNIIKQLEVPVDYRKCSFENYDGKDNQMNLLQLKIATDQGFETPTGENINLYLWGKGAYGVGKTHLLYASIQEYLRSNRNIRTYAEAGIPVVEFVGKSVCILSEYEFIGMLKDTFKPNSETTEMDIFRKLNRYKLLCLDDVAKYTPANLDFYQRVMFQLVDYRCKNQLGIFITGNKSLHNLAEFVGYATADRLQGMITQKYQLEFHGKTHRYSG